MRFPVDPGDDDYPDGEPSEYDVRVKENEVGYTEEGLLAALRREQPSMQDKVRTFVEANTPQNTAGIGVGAGINPDDVEVLWKGKPLERMTFVPERRYLLMCTEGHMVVSEENLNREHPQQCQCGIAFTWSYSHDAQDARLSD